MGVWEETSGGSGLSVFLTYLWPASLDVNPAHQGKIDSNQHTWKRLFSALKNNGKNA